MYILFLYINQFLYDKKRKTDKKEKKKPRRNHKRCLYVNSWHAIVLGPWGALVSYRYVDGSFPHLLGSFSPRSSAGDLSFIPEVCVWCFLPEHPQRWPCHTEPHPATIILGPQGRFGESDTWSWLSVPLESVSLLLACPDWFTAGTQQLDGDVLIVSCDVLRWFSLIMSWLGLPLLLYFYFYFQKLIWRNGHFETYSIQRFVWFCFSSFCSRLQCLESGPMCAGIAFQACNSCRLGVTVRSFFWFYIL